MNIILFQECNCTIRKFGSAALDLANVAYGRFDGFWQREINYWDIAAGEIILKRVKVVSLRN